MKADPALLDRFLPRFDVRERFDTVVAAPADLVLQTAVDFDMQSLPLVKLIFRTRETLMGAKPPPRRSQGIVAETTSLGWGVLASQSGRYIACGAACQPWLADVTFIPIPAEAFADYGEPDRVKIAWTLETEPLGPETTRLSHETRAMATDDQARIKFRRYWRWARFGIIAIRLLLLPAVRRSAQRQWMPAKRVESVGTKRT